MAALQIQAGQTLQERERHARMKEAYEGFVDLLHGDEWSEFFPNSLRTNNTLRRANFNLKPRRTGEPAPLPKPHEGGKLWRRFTDTVRRSVLNELEPTKNFHFHGHRWTTSCIDLCSKHTSSSCRLNHVEKRCKGQAVP